MSLQLTFCERLRFGMAGSQNMPRIWRKLEKLCLKLGIFPKMGGQMDLRNIKNFSDSAKLAVKKGRHLRLVHAVSKSLAVKGNNIFISCLSNAF